MGSFKGILIYMFILAFGCKHAEDNTHAVTQNSLEEKSVVIDPTKIDSTKLGLNYKPKGNYNTITSNIKANRAYFKSLLLQDESKAIDSASVYLRDKLLNAMVPHWYGTTWDFNGHTNIPNKGKIACGYFVSTTLKHLGFNLNRYKMAQQAGLIEAKMLQPKSDLNIYSGLTYNALKTKLNSAYDDGLYFVGLDNHVGYVLIKDQELYFLHSSYCDNKVLIELAEHSYCFQSNLYVFAELFTNKDLVKKWILDTRISVPN